MRDHWSASLSKRRRPMPERVIPFIERGPEGDRQAPRKRRHTSILQS